MTIYFSLLISIIGAAVYILAGDPSKELGRNAFWCGLLAFLLGFAGPTISLGR